MKLTLLQKKILLCILVQDALLSSSHNNKTFRLHIYISIKHNKYVFHLYDIFKEFCLTKFTIITRTYSCSLCKNKTHQMISFKAVSSAIFKFYAFSLLNCLSLTS